MPGGHPSAGVDYGGSSGASTGNSYSGPSGNPGEGVDYGSGDDNSYGSPRSQQQVVDDQTNPTVVDVDTNDNGMSPSASAVVVAHPSDLLAAYSANYQRPGSGTAIDALPAPGLGILGRFAGSVGKYFINTVVRAGEDVITAPIRGRAARLGFETMEQLTVEHIPSTGGQSVTSAGQLLPGKYAGSKYSVRTVYGGDPSIGGGTPAPLSSPPSPGGKIVQTGVGVETNLPTTHGTGITLHAEELGFGTRTNRPLMVRHGVSPDDIAQFGDSAGSDILRVTQPRDIPNTTVVIPMSPSITIPTLIDDIIPMQPQVARTLATTTNQGGKTIVEVQTAPQVATVPVTAAGGSGSRFVGGGGGIPQVKVVPGPSRFWDDKPEPEPENPGDERPGDETPNEPISEGVLAHYFGYGGGSRSKCEGEVREALKHDNPMEYATKYLTDDCRRVLQDLLASLS